MAAVRARVGVSVVLAVLSPVLAGCVFPGLVRCGEPLTREALRDSLGIPAEPLSAEQIDARVRELDKIKPVPRWKLAIPFYGLALALSGESALDYANDYPIRRVRGRRIRSKTRPPFVLPLPLVPSRVHHERIMYLQDRASERKTYHSRRRLYSWLMAAVYSRDRSEWYTWPRGDWVASGDLVLVLGLVGYVRSKAVCPVDMDMTLGILDDSRFLRPECDPRTMRYDIVESSRFLLGLFGWGHVNHRRYVQVLWIPIPTGEKEK